MHSHELNEQGQHVPSLSVMHHLAFLLVFEVTRTDQRHAYYYYYNSCLCILFAVRIESSAQAFRGFAIQARESTPSFSSAAEFVGEFVNPPPGANWQIWSCGAVRLCSTIFTLHPGGPGPPHHEQINACR